MPDQDNEPQFELLSDEQVADMEAQEAACEQRDQSRKEMDESIFGAFKKITPDVT